MPVYCKCHVSGCDHDGAHGFVMSVMFTRAFYHTTSEGKTHYWYSGMLPSGEHVRSEHESEVFERCVVPAARQRSFNEETTEVWIQAQRARIRGDEKAYKRLKNKWFEMSSK